MRFLLTVEANYFQVSCLLSSDVGLWHSEQIHLFGMMRFDVVR